MRRGQKKSALGEKKTTWGTGGVATQRGATSREEAIDFSAKQKQKTDQ